MCNLHAYQALMTCSSVLDSHVRQLTNFYPRRPARATPLGLIPDGIPRAMVAVSGIHGEEGMEATHGYEPLDLVDFAMRQECYRC